MPARRSSRPACLLGLSLLVAALLAGCGHGHKTPAEQIAAQAYLTALGNRDQSAAAATTTNATAAGAAIGGSLTGLGPAPRVR